MLFIYMEICFLVSSTKVQFLFFFKFLGNCMPYEAHLILLDHLMY